MEIYGTIVTIEKDVDIQKQSGGSYPGTRIIYKDNKGNIKSKTFHEKALKYNRTLSDQIDSLVDGDSFIMEQEKNGDFWNVTSIQKDTKQMSKQKVTNNNTASDQKNYDNSSWDNKQNLIIRQNVLGNSIKYYSEIKKEDVSLEQIFITAKLMEQYVNSGEVPGIEELDNMEDDLL